MDNICRCLIGACGPTAAKNNGSSACGRATVTALRRRNPSRNKRGRTVHSYHACSALDARLRVDAKVARHEGPDMSRPSHPIARARYLRPRPKPSATAPRSSSAIASPFDAACSPQARTSGSTCKRRHSCTCPCERTRTACRSPPNARPTPQSGTRKFRGWAWARSPPSSTDKWAPVYRPPGCAARGRAHSRAARPPPGGQRAWRRPQAMGARTRPWRCCIPRGCRKASGGRTSCRSRPPCRSPTPSPVGA
mmetsp:Transcript_68966/g.190958  ORF Transcript_68966/g.190958 Transcript_68966/m.190958 type:complete len:251 (+) Transcript_68966:318-1070(+)